MSKLLLGSRRRRLGTLALAAAVLVTAAWVFNPRRKVPLSHALNPAFWLRHWRGTDTYDPRTALLEHGDYGAPEIALTIDDGPDPKYGPEIANLLKRENVPCAFFLVGVNIKKYPNVTRLLARDGFELGNHTYDHQRLDALPPHQIANELRLCDKHLFAATGLHATFMRPPGMQYNDKVLDVAKALGYVTVDWTVGARDYEPQPAGFIAQRVIDRADNGAIILLHQDQASTVTALPTIIESLRKQGYQFVSLRQMLGRVKK